ncbi:MAG: hypothetical protein ACMG6S_06260 [Byssovorax sp.]
MRSNSSYSRGFGRAARSTPGSMLSPRPSSGESLDAAPETRMAAAPLNLELLTQVLPLEDAVRIELREGVPVFRARSRIQERIEELLEKQPAAPLTEPETRELLQYEELDDFLSLVNRLVRNSMHASGGEPGVGKAP